MLLEPLGSDLFVTVEAAGSNVVARLAPSTPLQRGDTIALAPDAAHAHLFAADTGMRVAG